MSAIRITAASLVAALALTGCAINPATGKRQFVLVSEAQEQAIGRENDTAMVEQLGLYEDEQLQRYVSGIGHELAALSERPELDWHFRVVDDPVVNAFALPGGFVYITRGILGHFNDEAELASVLGHEIGHVTARHGVSQMTKAQFAQLGLIGGMVLGGDRAAPFLDLAQTLTGLAFLRFSRDDEKQADDLGLRYMTRGGYDARRMPGVFETLGRVSDAGGGERLPGWLSTHPLPDNRSGRIFAEIEATGTDYTAARVGRDGYLAKIDGMVFGADPRHGYFKESRFYHPEMKFQARFPDGWRLINQRNVVAAVSPEQDAVVALSLDPAASADAALAAFFDKGARRGTTLRPAARLSAAGSTFSADTESGTVSGAIVFVEHGDRVFRLLAYCPDAGWTAYRGTLEAAVQSFDRLTDPRLFDVEPQRVRVFRATASTDLARFAEIHRSSIPLEQLAILNGLEPGARVEAGAYYKVVVGELP